MTSQNKSVAVLGGGISGLSTAYALQQKGIRVSVYELADEAGGVIKTVKQDGWQTEAGPNSLLLNSDKIGSLLEELGLKPQIEEANPKARKRFIVKNGQPTALPLSVWDAIKSDLLSLGSKLRLLGEPFVKARPSEDESIASFFRRRIGQEPVDYGINPFVSGVYAGDPEQLSIKHTFDSLYKMEQSHGSMFKGMLAKRNDPSPSRTLISFRDGMQALPNHLAEQLGKSLKLEHTVEQIESTNGRWSVRLNTESGKQQNMHDVVISTLPAYLLSKIIADKQVKTMAQKLEQISYVPLSVLHLGFQKEKVSHPLDGFGMLIPKKENYKLLGALFPSTLFPNRAPSGHALLTCFIGGARNPELAGYPQEELVALALNDLDSLLGIAAKPVFTRHTFWENAIPQYRTGYDRYLSIMDEIEQSAAGLFLSGNYRGGVSVPDRLSAGLENARKVELFLKESTS